MTTHQVFVLPNGRKVSIEERIVDSSIADLTVSYHRGGVPASHVHAHGRPMAMGAAHRPAHRSVPHFVCASCLATSPLVAEASMVVLYVQHEWLLCSGCSIAARNNPRRSLRIAELVARNVDAGSVSAPPQNINARKEPA